MTKEEQRIVDLDLDVQNVVKQMAGGDPKEGLIYSRYNADSDNFTYMSHGEHYVTAKMFMKMLHNDEIRHSIFTAFTTHLAELPTDKHLFLGGLDMAGRYIDRESTPEEATENARKDVDGRVVAMANELHGERKEGEGVMYCRAHNKGNTLEVSALVGDPAALGIGMKNEMERDASFSHFIQQLVAIYLAERPDEHMAFQQRMVKQVEYARKNNLIKFKNNDERRAADGASEARD